MTFTQTTFVKLRGTVTGKKCILNNKIIAFVWPFDSFLVEKPILSMKYNKLEVGLCFEYFIFKFLKCCLPVHQKSTGWMVGIFCIFVMHYGLSRKIPLCFEVFQGTMRCQISYFCHYFKHYGLNSQKHNSAAFYVNFRINHVYKYNFSITLAGHKMWIHSLGM